MMLSERALLASTTHIANMSELGAKVFSRKAGVKTTTLNSVDIKLIIAKAIVAKLREKCDV